MDLPVGRMTVVADPEGAARALLGRGPGLTPEGDDLLAAVAGTLAVLGPTTGLHGNDLAALLTAIGVEDPKRAGSPTPATGSTSTAWPGASASPPPRCARPWPGSSPRA